MVTVSDRVAGDLMRCLPRVLARCRAETTRDINAVRIVRLALRAIEKAKDKNNPKYGRQQG